MPICDCGKEINYKTLGGVIHKIEGKMLNFIPNQVEGDMTYVNKHGLVTKGVRDPRGSFGYKLHVCPVDIENKKSAYAFVGERG